MNITGYLGARLVGFLVVLFAVLILISFTARAYAGCQQQCIYDPWTGQTTCSTWCWGTDNGR